MVMSLLNSMGSGVGSVGSWVAWIKVWRGCRGLEWVHKILSGVGCVG